MRYVGALDQGTTSTRFALVDETGAIVASAQEEHEQIFPRPGWVEHDASEIWRHTESVIAGCVERAGAGTGDLAAVGVTNQRETAVAWDRKTGLPLGPAIVWQDTRTADLVAELGGRLGPDRFRDVCGLPLATYFSGPKYRWMLENIDAVASAARSGSLCLGTIDSWLLWRLTGEHLTDVTNASRTMLMSLASLDWDDEVLDAMGVPRDALPEIRPSIGGFGEATGPLAGAQVTGVLGDQQAAMFGQACFTPGSAKNTYGTGCFLLVNTGTTAQFSDHGLLTTVGYQIRGAAPVFALEGSVAVAGAAVQWLRDNLGLIESASDIEELAARVADNGGVYFVPAFSGLFAPYWRGDARGVIAGLTRYATAAHLARATLEATAFQTFDVIAAMRQDSGVDPEILSVDGGMAANDLLMQFQADILGIPVRRPQTIETTVLGAAFAAGLGVGFFESTGQIGALWAEDRRWTPSMPAEARRRLLDDWHKAVDKSMGWAG